MAEEAGPRGLTAATCWEIIANLAGNRLVCLRPESMNPCCAVCDATLGEGVDVDDHFINCGECPVDDQGIACGSAQEAREIIKNTTIMRAAIGVGGRTPWGEGRETGPPQALLRRNQILHDSLSIVSGPPLTKQIPWTEDDARPGFGSTVSRMQLAMILAPGRRRIGEYARRALREALGKAHAPRGDATAKVVPGEGDEDTGILAARPSRSEEDMVARTLIDALELGAALLDGAARGTIDWAEGQAEAAELIKSWATEPHVLPGDASARVPRRLQAHETWHALRTLLTVTLDARAHSASLAEWALTIGKLRDDVGYCELEDFGGPGIDLDRPRDLETGQFLRSRALIWIVAQARRHAAAEDAAAADDPLLGAECRLVHAHGTATDKLRREHRGQGAPTAEVADDAYRALERWGSILNQAWERASREVRDWIRRYDGPAADLCRGKTSGAPGTASRLGSEWVAEWSAGNPQGGRTLSRDTATVLGVLAAAVAVLDATRGTTAAMFLDMTVGRDGELLETTLVGGPDIVADGGAVHIRLGDPAGWIQLTAKAAEVVIAYLGIIRPCLQALRFVAGCRADAGAHNSIEAGFAATAMALWQTSDVRAVIEECARRAVLEAVNNALAKRDNIHDVEGEAEPGLGRVWREINRGRQAGTRTREGGPDLNTIGYEVANAMWRGEPGGVDSFGHRGLCTDSASAAWLSANKSRVSLAGLARVNITVGIRLEKGHRECTKIFEAITSGRLAEGNDAWRDLLALAAGYSVCGAVLLVVPAATDAIAASNAARKSSVRCVLWGELGSLQEAHMADERVFLTDEPALLVVTAPDASQAARLQARFRLMQAAGMFFPLVAVQTTGGIMPDWLDAATSGLSPWRVAVGPNRPLHHGMSTPLATPLAGSGSRKTARLIGSTDAGSSIRRIRAGSTPSSPEEVGEHSLVRKTREGVAGMDADVFAGGWSKMCRLVSALKKLADHCAACEIENLLGPAGAGQGCTFTHKAAVNTAQYMTESKHMNFDKHVCCYTCWCPLQPDEKLMVCGCGHEKRRALLPLIFWFLVHTQQRLVSEVIRDCSGGVLQTDGGEPQPAQEWPRGADAAETMRWLGRKDEASNLRDRSTNVVMVIALTCHRLAEQWPIGETR